MRLNPMARTVAPLVAAALLAGGCASANKTATAATKAASSNGSSSMAGMNMSGGKSMSVGGIKPIPTQVLGTALWQGMKITARATTAVPFVVDDGTTSRTVKPTHKTSFHLMVMLNDAESGVPIPYSTVWATISRAGKVVYDERQWPMISRYMGPHYGNDVTVPGAGTYQLSLLVSPPVSARHMEYADVWQHPHRVTVTFHWKPVS